MVLNVVKIFGKRRVGYWLNRKLEDDEREINRWKRIVTRFRSILVKMIIDADSKVDDYSISRIGVMN